MFKQLHFKSWLLLVCMLVGASSAWADEVTDTYTFTSKSWTATLNEDESNWTSGKDGNQWTAAGGIQITSGVSGANATSPKSFSDISQILVYYHTNASKGTGSIELKIGDNAATSQNVVVTGGTTSRNLTYDYATPETGSITITVKCSVNSIYIEKIAITYDDGTTAKTASDFTLTSADEVALTITTANLNPTSQITYATSSTGTVSYESDDVSVATVSNTGLITAVAEGTTTIRVNQEEDENYAAATEQEITVTVTDNSMTAAPTITVNPSVIEAATDVEVTITGAGTIYYTTDGTDPEVGTSATATSDTPFTINLSETTTIKAVAKEADKLVSDVAEATITKYVQPTSVSITLNNDFFKCTAFTSVSETTPTSLTGSKDNVTVVYSKGSSANYYCSAGIRCYSGNSLIFSAPIGYNITGINFTKGSSWGIVTPSSGSISSQTWTGETDNVSFTVSARTDMNSATVTLEKIAPKYALTFSTDQTGGTIAVAKGATPVSTGDEFKAGTELTLTATPNTGYSFTTFTSTAGSFDAATNSPATFTMPESAAAVGATFTPTNYTFTATTDNGGKLSVKVGDAEAVLLASTETTSIAYGSSVTVTPVAVANYAFDEWTTTDFDIVDTKDNPLSFIMPANDVELLASFKDATVKYTITVDDNVVGGTIEADKEEATLGATVTLTATPNDGFEFVEWTVLDENAQTVTVTNNQFTMPSSNVEVSATFKQQFTVTYYVAGTPNNVTRLDGDALDLETPSAIGGMAFGGWSSANNTASPVFVANDAAVTGDMMLYAMFVQKAEKNAYYLVEEDMEDWRGDYLIAYDYKTFADGRKGGKDDAGSIGNSNVSVNPGSNLSGKQVDATWGDMYNVQLVAITDANLANGYLLKTKDGKYNYYSSNANGLSATTNSGTADDYPITVTFTSSSDVKLCLGGGATGAVFRYNPGGYFRFYKDGGQSAVYLYKKLQNPAIYSLGIPESVIVTSAQYATYCSTQNLDFSETGIKVYTAKATATKVELTEVSDGIVPAGAGVVLYSENPITTAVPAVATEKTTLADNELVGITERTQVNATEDGKLNYILANEPETGIGFYMASNGYLAANRAYLSTATAAAASRFLKMVDEGGATGIETVHSAEFTGHSYYDLQGRRVDSSQLRKGLYIVNGKKTVIK